MKTILLSSIIGMVDSNHIIIKHIFYPNWAKLTLPDLKFTLHQYKRDKIYLNYLIKILSGRCFNTLFFLLWLEVPIGQGIKILFLQIFSYNISTKPPIGIRLLVFCTITCKMISSFYLSENFVIERILYDARRHIFDHIYMHMLITIFWRWV